MRSKFLALSALGSLAFAPLSVVAPPAQAQNAAAPVRVQNVTPAQLSSAIARHRGKVVLVNFWASWCSPCVKELPEFARFARSNRQNVVVLLVSADEPSEVEQTRAILARNGHVSTLRVQGNLPDFFKSFDSSYRGAIALPITYIYNKRGQRVKTLREGEETQASLRAHVAPYLR